MLQLATQHSDDVTTIYSAVRGGSHKGSKALVGVRSTFHDHFGRRCGRCRVQCKDSNRQHI
jgi:hypothetical protein